MAIFAWRRGMPLLSLFDVAAASVPIGLFFGRLANFINGELWGRVDRRALGDGLSADRAGRPAAPSEPALRGGARGPRSSSSSCACSRIGFGSLRRPGLTGGASSPATALARIVVEFFREPDPQLGYLVGGS